MRYLIIWLIGILLFTSNDVLAVKVQDTIPVISFRVVNSATGAPVEMAHVVNSTIRDAAITDLLGYFKIHFKVGDTLSISSLGYFSLTIYNWGQYSMDSTYYTIKLNPRVYQLKELKISWFSSYDKFLKGISELRLPVTVEEKEIIRITEYFNRTIRKLDLNNLPSSGGIAFGRDWLAKQNEKLDERLKKESRQRQIERKFSAGIVSALTGLTGNEVHWFIAYCAFTDDFILNSSDYEIRKQVLAKYKIYSNNKKEKENN